jgi:hypothetical protein
LHAKLSIFDPPENTDYPTIYVCRRNALAALDALIWNWATASSVIAPTFTSYPEWAKYVGGIMAAADLGDPCKKDEVLDSMTSPTDWDDDLLVLARAVCDRAPERYFKTKELTATFIFPRFSPTPQPNLSTASQPTANTTPAVTPPPSPTGPEFPAFEDHYESITSDNRITVFNIALTKHLNQNLGVPLVDGNTVYRVERDRRRTIPHFKFTRVRTGGTSPSAGQSAAAPANSGQTPPPGSSPGSAPPTQPATSMPVNPAPQSTPTVAATETSGQESGASASSQPPSSSDSSDSSKSPSVPY